MIQFTLIISDNQQQVYFIIEDRIWTSREYYVIGYIPKEDNIKLIYILYGG